MVLVHTCAYIRCTNPVKWYLQHTLTDTCVWCVFTCVSWPVSGFKRFIYFPTNVWNVFMCGRRWSGALERSPTHTHTHTHLHTQTHTQTHTHTHVQEGHVLRLSGVCLWSEWHYKTQAGTLDFSFSFTELCVCVVSVCVCSWVFCYFSNLFNYLSV